MLIPIEIECPKCGAKIGERCVDPDQAHKNFHMISYSFCADRVFAARRQSEVSE
jgi:hypothetical protein